MALDFSSLSAALPQNAKELDFQPLQAPVSGGLVAELQAKFSNNKQAETQQMLAVLGACASVLASAGLPETPTAVFAASMSSLERAEIQASPEAGPFCCTFPTSRQSLLAHDPAADMIRHDCMVEHCTNLLACCQIIIMTLESEWPQVHELLPCMPFGSRSFLLACCLPDLDASGSLAPCLMALVNSLLLSPNRIHVLQPCKIRIEAVHEGFVMLSLLVTQPPVLLATAAAPARYSGQELLIGCLEIIIAPPAICLRESLLKPC